MLTRQHEPEIHSREVSGIWERDRNVDIRKTKPLGQCAGVLFDRRRRNKPSTNVGIVGPVRDKCREERTVRSRTSVEITAANRTSQNEVVAAPCVVGTDSRTRTRWIERA